MTYDASNRKDIRRAEKESARAERNRGAVLREIASTTAGREYLWHQLEAAHIFTTPFSLDTNQTMFNLGEQNAGLRLLADITQFCPEEFITAMREANGRRTQSNNANATADDTADTSAGEHGGGEEPRRELEGRQLDYDPTED